MKRKLMSLLLAAAMGAALIASSVAVSAESVSEEPAAAAEGYTPKNGEQMVVINSTKGMDNQYYAELDRGGKEFCEQMGWQYVTLSSQDDEQKQIADLESGLVTYDPDFVIIMPTSSMIVPALCDLCEEAKVPFVTLWDYPEGFDFTTYEYHIAHLLTDMYNEGYTMAQYLFEAIGGSGKIVAIDGLLGSTTAVVRHEGLEGALAENPDIELLESLPGDWNRFVAGPAFEDLYIKYGDEIAGVWTANDDMALGVEEILDGYGKLGEVKVVGLDCLEETMQMIKDGNQIMSMSGDAPGMQALALCIAYDYLNGGIIPESRDERHFVMYAPPIITQENVDEYTDLWYGEKAKDRDWTADSVLLQQ